MAENSRRTIGIAVVAGVLCGGALIFTTIESKNGWLMLLPYVVLAIVSVVYLRGRRHESFSQRFVACLVSFVVATVMVDTFINTVVHPHAIANMTAWRFLGPLGAMVLLGAAGSAVVAAIAGVRKTAR